MVQDKVASTFGGCVRHLRLNKVEFGTPSRVEGGAQSCSVDDTEHGLFFGADSGGGLAVIADKFDVSSLTLTDTYDAITCEKKAQLL